MNTALGRLFVVEPPSLGKALAALDGHLVPMAGCTDLLVGLNFGTIEARRYLNLWGLRELRGIRKRIGGGVIVGALTTFAELAASPLVRREAQILAEAALQIGGVQIQNRATLGGNIANASPAADAAPVLAVAAAVVHVASARGERQIPYQAFHTGYRKTALAPHELIVAIEIPRLPAGARFRKVGTRAANAISKVVAAVVPGPAPRIALGSVAPTVMRASRTEAALAAGANIAEATAMLAQEIAPIDDLRSTAEYRRRVAAKVVADLLGGEA